MPNVPQDTNDTYILSGSDIVTTRDYTIEALNNAKINFIGDVRINDETVGTPPGGFVTQAELDAAIAAATANMATDSELAAAVAPMATDSELAAAVAPLATTAALNAAITPLATTAALNAHIAVAATDSEVTAAIAAIPKGKTVTAYSGTAVTAAIGDANCYLRFTGTNPTLTIPLNATVAFPTGTTLDGVGTATAMTIAATGGVAINKARTLVTVAADSGWSLIKVATDEWDAHGDFV